MYYTFTNTNDEDKYNEILEEIDNIEDSIKICECDIELANLEDRLDTLKYNKRTLESRTKLCSRDYYYGY